MKPFRTSVTYVLTLSFHLCVCVYVFVRITHHPPYITPHFTSTILTDTCRKRPACRNKLYGDNVMIIVLLNRQIEKSISLFCFRYEPVEGTLIINRRGGNGGRSSHLLLYRMCSNFRQRRSRLFVRTPPEKFRFSNSTCIPNTQSTRFYIVSKT